MRRTIAWVVIALAAVSVPGVAAAQAVGDTTPPSLTLPADMTVTPLNPAGAYVWYSATATDDTDLSVAVNCTPPPGINFPVGTTTVDCTATDSSGNVASGSFTVTVVGDETPPTLHLPADITVEPMMSDGAYVWYYAWASDDKDMWVAVNCTPAWGTVFPIGTTTVECSASDSWGNVAQGSFTVTVLQPLVAKLAITGGTVDPATGVATIIGTVECTRGGAPAVPPANAMLFGQITQRIGRTLITGSFSPAGSVDCSSPASTWRLATVNSTGLFVAGSADVKASVFPGASAGTSAEATIKLRPER